MARTELRNEPSGVRTDVDHQNGWPYYYDEYALESNRHLAKRQSGDLDSTKGFIKKLGTGAAILFLGAGAGAGINHMINSNNDQRANETVSGPAVPGTNQEASDRTNPEAIEPATYEYQLTTEELDRMNQSVREGVVERVEYAKDTAASQNRLDPDYDHSYSFDRDSLGGSGYVSVRSKPSLTGHSITFHDSYRAFDGYTKTVIMVFDTTDKTVDDPVDTIGNSDDVRLKSYSVSRDYDRESGAFGTIVTIDGDKVRAFNYEDAVENVDEDTDEGKTKHTYPQTEDQYVELIDQVIGYKGADQ